VTFTIDQNEEVDVARALGCDDISFFAACRTAAARHGDAAPGGHGVASA